MRCGPCAQLGNVAAQKANEVLTSAALSGSGESSPSTSVTVSDATTT